MIICFISKTLSHVAINEFSSLRFIFSVIFLSFSIVFYTARCDSGTLSTFKEEKKKEENEASRLKTVIRRRLRRPARSRRRLSYA